MSVKAWCYEYFISESLFYNLIYSVSLGNMKFLKFTILIIVSFLDMLKNLYTRINIIENLHAHKFSMDILEWLITY